MTEEVLRDRLVQTARSWVGKNQADGSHRLLIDLYNAHRPLARDYSLSYEDPWCAATVSALAIICGLTAIIPVECSCSRMIEGLKQRNSWREEDAYRPLPGDILFYDWQDRTGPAADNQGAPDHTGVVEAVQERFMVIIEGNRSHAVRRRAVALNGRWVRGFGVPDYAGEAAGRAVEALWHLRVLDSPELWRQHLILGDIPHLGLLLGKAADVIQRQGRRTETAAEGLARLTAAGVINRPAFWRARCEDTPGVSALIRALGGAV